MAIQIPPAAAPASPVDQAIDLSAARFETSLRAELGLMAGLADVPKYVANYRAELRAFFDNLVQLGIAKK